MTPETKMRIDQIRRGEVPEGYRKGKLGIVPYEWDEVPFSTLFTSTSNYTDDLNTYPLYSLTIEDGITPKTERYERSHLVKKENSYKIVCPNDYAYNPMNIRFGAVARHKGNKPVAVSGYYDIFTTVHQSDLVFMDSFLTCGSMMTYYNKVSTGSLVEKQRVHFSNFLSFSLPLPPLKERKKISEIIKLQEQVIELNSQMIRQLELMKKACLRKMFPEHGNNVPEVRFPGFTDPWEQRRLSDEFSDFIVPMRDKPKEFGGNIPWTRIEDIESKYLNGTLSGQYVTEETVKEMNLKIIPKDSLIVSSSATFGAVAVVTQDLITNQTFIGLVPNDKNTLDYWYAFFYSDNARKYMRLRSAGSTIFYIARESFENMPIKVPPKDEMIKIGAYFDNLDNLITLHQRRLDEEKQKKKALMQLLFSGIVRVTV